MPIMWKGTPIDATPIADAVKWCVWNAAWTAANERAEHGRFEADAKKALTQHQEHAVKLTTLLPVELAESIRWMAWNSAWYSANERRGFKDDANKAKSQFDEHSAAVANHVPEELAKALKDLCSNASWHASNSRTKGCVEDSKKDLRGFEASAKLVQSLSSGFPITALLPKIGPPPPREQQNRRKRRQMFGSRAAPLTQGVIEKIKRHAKRKLQLRLKRLRADAALAAMSEQDQQRWDAAPLPQAPTAMVVLGQGAKGEGWQRLAKGQGVA